MSSEQSDVLAAAKSGNAIAIASLLNRALASKGITAKVSGKREELLILLEANDIPPKEVLGDFIEKGINKLGITTVSTVELHGYCTGSDAPQWTYEFSPRDYHQPAAATSSITVAKPKVTSIYSPKPASIKRVSQDSSAFPRRLVIIGASSAFGLLLILMGSWFGLTRAAQAKRVEKAQVLASEVSEITQSEDLAALKANQEALTSNQEKIEAAIQTLEDSPRLPFLNSGDVEIELGKAKQQLDAVQTNLKDTQEKISILEQLLPVLQEVQDSFAALDSALDVGMNYRDYGEQVRQIKVAIDKLSRQPSGTEHPAYQDLNLAFDHYSFAYDVWKYYIESDETHNFFPANNEYASILINNYGVTKTGIVGRDYIYLKDALSNVWDKASQQVELAQEKV